jgi:hypothetical protein
MGLRATLQRRFQAIANLAYNGLERELVSRLIYHEQLARLGACSPRSMERHKVPPRIGRPHRQYADMAGSGLKLTGDIRRQVPIGEQGLRIPCWNDVELSVVVQLTDGEQRLPFTRCAESQCVLELVSLRFSGTAPGQQPMCVLTRDAELTGQICDRETLTPQ